MANQLGAASEYVRARVNPHYSGPQTAELGQQEAPPTPLPEVAQIMNKLEYQISRLQDASNTVESRLNPVLQSSAPSSVDPTKRNVEKEPGTALGLQIDDCAFRVERVVEVLHSLINRLGV